LKNQKPTVLLHGCCGPCVTHPYQLLQKEYAVTIYFYNPNIHPRKEYEKRFQAVKDLSERWGYSLLIGPYEVKEWISKIRGFEEEPEGGERCRICYRMRLEKTAQAASSRGFDFFGTTLTVSPHKKANVIHEIGEKYESQFDVRYLEADFKKKDGFKLSCSLSRQEGLYRQHYCGCLFSQSSDSQKD